MCGDCAVESRPDRVAWSDSSARGVLQLMVESVAEMIGFEVAALSVVLEGELHTMAFTGPEEIREQIMGVDPVSVLDPVLAQAETWGRFRFLAGEDYDHDIDGHWAVTMERRADHPDAWHPYDVLLGCLRDDRGDLVGVLSVDRPVSGHRPGATQRRLLERYAAQAERAVLTAFEREALVQQVAQAEAARRIIRSASMPAQASLEAVLAHTHRPLVEGFRASGTWIQVLEPDVGRGYARSRHGELVDLSDRVVDLARQLAPRLWEEQRVLVVADDEEPWLPEGSTADLLDEARRQLAELGVASMLAVPLGVGAGCLGFLVLTRRAEDPPWSSVEVDSALQIGHDLGAALMTSRALERERRLVLELQQLDDYRGQLIATLSHELRTPLTVISGNLEMLADLGLEGPAARYEEAMTRGARRMQKVVDDLLMLARVSHPQHPLVRAPVDLRVVVDDVVALVESTARSKGLDLQVRLDGSELVVRGDAAELDRLLGNLLSNAVKYTSSGGTVTVSAARHGDQVVLAVADDGLGIAEEDQVGLFHAFFRTANPDALSQPGTGLGLAIVERIVDRHEGTVQVASTLGVGTTFTVTLPAV
ncbi:ATPase domain-containing protein [Nocardioides sp. PD653]|nr:ATPase domain-containing protein [Nocardioides sp. PD653-B2]GAW54697.1 ATPase domain-containing protein [Nocardioides sp. PD653]